MDLIEQSYIFTDRELLILLATSGIECIYGFELPKEDDVTREEMIHSLHSLISKKFLISGDIPGKPYDLGEQIYPLFSIIKNAECTIEAVSPDDERQMIFYKAGDSFTMIEREEKFNDKEEDRFRLRTVTAPEFEDLLSDMPSSFGAENLLKEEEAQKYLKISTEIYETGQNMLKGRVPLSEPAHDFLSDTYPYHEEFKGYIELKHENKARCLRFVIMEQGVYKYIIFDDDVNAEINIYTEEKQSQLISQLLNM